MPSQRLQKRTRCADCNQRFRGDPTQLAFLEKGTGGAHWVWNSLYLCPVCRQAWKHQVLAGPRGVPLDAERRRGDRHQLAGAAALEIESELSRDDLVDLETERQFRRAASR